MPTSRLTLLALTSMLVPATATLANAATVQTGKPAASQAARGYASRAQLRECMDLEAGLKDRLHAIEAGNAAHDQKFDATQAEDAQLVEVQSRLDHGDAAAVRSFNQLVTAHNLHVRQLNADAADAQAASDAYNADMLTVNHQCSPLTFRPEDMDAVAKERKNASSSR